MGVRVAVRETMDMGATGKYHMFNRPHGMIGDMMNKPPEMATCRPLDDLVPRARHRRCGRAHRGRMWHILNGPMEVPGGDRVVNAVDPRAPRFRSRRRRSEQMA